MTRSVPQLLSDVDDQRCAAARPGADFEVLADNLWALVCEALCMIECCSHNDELTELARLRCYPNAPMSWKAELDYDVAIIKGLLPERTRS